MPNRLASRLTTIALLLVGTLLYAAGLPPVSLGLCCVLGIALLGYISPRCHFTTLWLFGIVLHLGLYAWLTNVTYMGTLAMAALMGAFWAVPFHLWKRWGNPVGVATVWVLLELTRTKLGWGWLSISSSAIDTPAIGWLAIGGETLLGALIVSTGFFLSSALRKPRQRSTWIRFIATLVILLAGNPVANKFSTTQIVENLKPLRAGVIQPDTRMDLDKPTEEMMEEFTRLSQLSNQLKGHTDIIIWPEQMTPWPINTDARMRNWVETGAEFLEADIITGALWEERPQQNPDTDVSSETTSRFYNAIAQARQGIGLLPQYYAKRRLVPFGEYVPFSWLHSFTPIVDSFSAGSGEVRSLLVHGGWRLWPLICYEDTFADLSEGAAANADAILVLTNDAWFGKLGAHQQHFAHSVMRAVEQGLPLLRVANNGISGLVAPDGSSKIMLDADDRSDTANAKLVELPPMKRKTLYAATPLWLWPTFAWVLCILLIRQGIGRRLSK